MRKSIFYILFLSLTICTHGQSNKKYWKQWNDRYPKVDITSVLESEKRYADKVEKDTTITPYYLRTDRYRFEAEYLGETRNTSKEVISSMKRVYKLLIGDPTQLDGMAENEVLFRVGQEEIWMPIQPKVLEALKAEVNKGSIITLYCLFLNEHTWQNVLYNTLLISEFNELQKK